MSSTTDDLNRARAAIVSGDSQAALKIIEGMVERLQDTGLDQDEHHAVETALTELRILAQAALDGARAAMDQIAEVVQAARSLRTYDSAGRRHVANIPADMPRRY